VMNAPKKWLMMLLITITLLVTGCAVKENGDSTSLEPTGPDVFTSESDIDESTAVDTSDIANEALIGRVKDLIKTQFVWLEYEQIEIIEAFKEHFYMIKTERETLADGYLVYDSRNQMLYLMPLGIGYASSYDIVDESTIIFQMTGENSESNYHDVPYALMCFKVVNGQGVVEYTSVISKKIVPLEETIDFGGKSDHVLSSLILTLNGIQLGFSPQNSDDAYYYAAYTIPPYTQTTYNKAEHSLTLHLKDTIVGNELVTGKQAVAADNQYIEALDITQNGENINLKIKFKSHEDYKQLKSYSVEIVNSLNYPAGVSFSFYNESPFK
jgi:hypothetical protein